MKKKFADFNLRIGLANDATIRSWSFGEVTKAETINYKTEKPVRGGFFCEKIFGPVKDNECACGRYRRVKYKGKVCNICEVLVTESIVRRRRMGHIELEDPIVHIWYYKSIPSPIATFLNIKQSNLEKIVHYQAYTVIENGGDEDISLGSIVNLNINFSVDNKENKDARSILRRLLQKTILNLEVDSLAYGEAESFLFELDAGEDATFFIEEFIYFINEFSQFQLETGGIAIEKLLQSVNLKEEIKALKEKFSHRKAGLDLNNRFMKRLKMLNNFLHTGQKPEWMVTRTIPVSPPELRPIVHLDGGRFATSGTNKLYSDLLIRKNRLNKHREKFSPMFMINQLRAQVQEAANILFDKSLNNRGKTQIATAQEGLTRSIAENLKGKTGRFRQNLLGKRVDYSAGSVIVGNPTLKLEQFGLPRDIAVVLFRSAIIGELLSQEQVSNKKAAEKMIDEREPIIWDILEELIKGYPMILNRAPTLHRLGIQAFFPKMVRGKAIQLHPLVTTSFNADFDGDRMAIHLPLTEAAKTEAKDILLSTHNILNPRNGQLIVLPSQDIILGLYYLTFEKAGELGSGSKFATPDLALLAYKKKKINLHAVIFLPASSVKKTHFVNVHGWIATTTGKLIFNDIFSSEFQYINDLNWKQGLHIFPLNSNLDNELKNYTFKKPINKIAISEIINAFFEQFDTEQTVILLDNLKELGFEYSTRSGITISLFDLFESQTSKVKRFAENELTLKKIEEMFQIGGITKQEARQERIKLWTKTKEDVENSLHSYFLKSDLRSSVFAMVDSGARGSIANVTQLVGMRGLMVNTKGHIIETPIKSSLVEGLDPLEFFISTYGARKGMVDTAMKTADSGYLTRRLVDVVHDVYTVMDDCQTEDFFEVQAILYRQTNSEIVSLYERIYGRYTAKAVYGSNQELVVPADVLITHELGEKIIAHKVTQVAIRSALTCIAPRGVCQKCYGLDLSTRKLIKRGQAIGVLAAQSIGEPATQLTMRTFHTGGVSDVSDITQGLPRVTELVDVLTPKKNQSELSLVNGVVVEIDNKNEMNTIVSVKENDTEIVRYYNTPPWAPLLVKVNDKVEAGDPLTEGLIDLKQLLRVSKSFKKVAQYIIEEIQKVYCLQGIELADKYIEIVVRKIMSRVQIINPGESNYIRGETHEKYILDAENIKLAANNAKLIEFTPIICGTKALAIKTHSFLSAASFQQTSKVLIQAVIENRTDPLYGLKENVIVGNMIPVGTGYHEVEPLQEEEKTINEKKSSSLISEKN